MTQTKFRAQDKAVTPGRTVRPDGRYLASQVTREKTSEFRLLKREMEWRG